MFGIHFGYGWLQAKIEGLTSGLTIGTWKREVLEGLSTMSALKLPGLDSRFPIVSIG